MRLDARLKRIEQYARTEDENALVYVVRIPEKLSFEEWARKARKQAHGLSANFPTREIRYTRGVRDGLN
jgi:hypothetical protein